jgi:hypothetical protein
MVIPLAAPVRLSASRECVSQVALRERKFDIVLMKGVPKLEQHIALDIGYSVGGVFDPEA